MAKEFSVIIERDAEGYYVEPCLEVQGDSVEPLDFIGVQKITVA